MITPLFQQNRCWTFKIFGHREITPLELSIFFVKRPLFLLGIKRQPITVPNHQYYFASCSVLNKPNKKLQIIKMKFVSFFGLSPLESHSVSLSWKTSISNLIFQSRSTQLICLFACVAVAAASGIIAGPALVGAPAVVGVAPGEKAVLCSQ